MNKSYLQQMKKIEEEKKQMEEQLRFKDRQKEELTKEQISLRQRLKQLETFLHEEKQRFLNEEEKVNRDTRVLSLQDKLQEYQHKFTQLEQVSLLSSLFSSLLQFFLFKEFVAYKSYTSSLLNKEKNLNERLQSLLTGNAKST